MLYFDCADNRLLEKPNLEGICSVLGTEVGDFKRIRLLGASESIARRLRNGIDVNIFEEQFEEAAEMGLEIVGFGHHGDCQWYKRIISQRITKIGLTFTEIELYYDQIEKVIQFLDISESYNWVMKKGWFRECILTFGYNTNEKNTFVFETLSAKNIVQEIDSLRKELVAGFTPDQLKCLGVI